MVILFNVQIDNLVAHEGTSLFCHKEKLQLGYLRKAIYMKSKTTPG